MLKRRRYEAEQSPREVREDVLRALGDNTLTLVELDISLTDMYEEGLEIPPDIERREVAIAVTGAAKNTRREHLRAHGYTTDKLAATITIPYDDSGRCTVSLLDK